MGVITRATAGSDARESSSSDGTDAVTANPDPFLQTFRLDEGWNLDPEDLLTALQTVAVIVALASRRTE